MCRSKVRFLVPKRWYVYTPFINMTTTIEPPRERPESDTVTLEAIRGIVYDEVRVMLREIVHDELIQVFDFTRTCLLSGNMEGVEPRKSELPHSGESEFEGTIREVHRLKEDKVFVPYLASVKVKDIYESSSDKITQKVLLEDDTSSIILTMFSNNELKPLEKSKTYNITKLKTNIYNDSFSVNTTGATTVSEDVENIEWSHDENRTMDQLDLL
jgi:DNA polymerase III alpha subunit (gram-positive type)